ncbi:MAG: ATP-binding protein [Monoglobales bacterium]
MNRIKLTEIKLRIDSLAIFRSILSDKVIESLCAYLDAPSVFRYGAFVSALYESGHSSLGKLILSLCENSDNVYVRALGEGKSLSKALQITLSSELSILQLVADITPQELKAPLEYQWILPEFDFDEVNIKDSYLNRIKNIGKFGYGIFANHHMFCLDESGKITPVRYPDKISLDDLIDYEAERQIVIDNTKALIEGKPAANILLTGDAGTGKSSTIKAVANKFYREGVRIVEVNKNQLGLIPNLLDELASNPLKFIIFIDDLSFATNDDNFSALKAVLEGSVCAKSGNVVIYSTSNRRHIVRERFSDRDGDDVHRNDTMQEIISLSELFGKHITFQKPSKTTYLHIVRTLAQQKGINLPADQLDAKAEQMALHRGGRSGRLAKQLIDELIASS